MSTHANLCRVYSCRHLYQTSKLQEGKLMLLFLSLWWEAWGCFCFYLTIFVEVINCCLYFFKWHTRTYTHTHAHIQFYIPFCHFFHSSVVFCSFLRAAIHSPHLTDSLPVHLDLGLSAACINSFLFCLGMWMYWLAPNFSSKPFWVDRWFSSILFNIWTL